MYEVTNAKPSKEFIECFNIAGEHLQQYLNKHIGWRWLKSTPFGPYLEHLSFFLGNQVFFIQLIDADKKYDFPGTRSGLISKADGYGGYACQMPMYYKKGFLKSGWQPKVNGWGLLDVHTGRPIVPDMLVTEKPVPITSWELHDFAIQIVRSSLEKEGKQILSWSCDPQVDPSLWFQNGDQRAWVVVRGYKYPDLAATQPNLTQLKNELMKQGYPGYYAEVGFTNCDDPAIPIMRGDCCNIKYTGIQKLSEVYIKQNFDHSSIITYEDILRNKDILQSNTFKRLLVLGKKRGVFNNKNTVGVIPELLDSVHIVSNRIRDNFTSITDINSVINLHWIVTLALTSACWIGMGADYQFRYDRDNQQNNGIYEALIRDRDFPEIPLYIIELIGLEEKNKLLISKNFMEIAEYLTLEFVEQLKHTSASLEDEFLRKLSLAFLYGCAVAHEQVVDN